MIPKIIHYCWFGRGDLPQLAMDCVASWHKYMPDWEYKLWNEDSFDVTQVAYTKEAYEARKYAFVSDYVRLWALNKFGGLYLDVDFVVFKPFDDLLHWNAFAGFEGSKHSPLMMGVVASCAFGVWVQEQLDHYKDRHFIMPDGSFDMTTNVQFITEMMKEQGFVQNGKEQDYKDLHVFPVDYFCPRQTTGEYFRTENTYCDHLGLRSWSEDGVGWKAWLLKLFGQRGKIWIIKTKRRFENL